jgi:hypothetical protein
VSRFARNTVDLLQSIREIESKATKNINNSENSNSNINN